MARLYSMQKIRDIIGEADANNDTTNKRIREAGELSQSEFVRAMRNLRDIPITDETEEEKELVNFGGSAYFYFLENGDKLLLEQYSLMIDNHIKFKFGRPNMITRGQF